MKKLINNELVDMTAEEISASEQLSTQGQAEFETRQQAEAQKVADAQSGNQKLLDLGLTQAEATALTGYTPPSEV